MIVRKGFREAERLLQEMGFTILGSGRAKHHYWIVRTPGGKVFKQPIPHNTTEHRFWHNWKSQLRRHLHDDAHTVNPRDAEQARAR
jgi:hypothetical protein